MGPGPARAAAALTDETETRRTVALDGGNLTATTTIWRRHRARSTQGCTGRTWVRKRRLTPRCRRCRGSGKRRGGRRGAAADRGEVEVGDDAVVLLVVVPGVVDVAGGAAVPSLVVLGLDDERSDDGEQLKSRPWRPSESLENRRENRRKLEGIWGGEGWRRRRIGGGTLGLWLGLLGAFL